MSYAEASFFDGAHFAHIALWEERKRIERVDRIVRKSLAAVTPGSRRQMRALVAEVKPIFTIVG